MSRNKKVLKMASKWVDRVGKLAARKKLTDRELGLSTADKIVAGTYHSTPGDRTVRILLEEMAKDGISLDDGIAS